MKVIAWYLPQFHETKENDEWWGKGFTDWVNVKQAKQFTPKQYQPRIPLNDNYYDLSDPSVMAWQVQIAKEHGVYGFCIHHYWFDGKMLLQKPLENYLQHTEIDFPFCISWANEHWTTQWNGSNKILMPQRYGAEDEWKEHFYYLLPFFKDKRYIKKDGKPLFVFYRADIVDCAKEMMECWQKLAKDNGLPGLCVSYAVRNEGDEWQQPEAKKMFDYRIDYLPGVVMWSIRKKSWYSFLLPIQRFMAQHFSNLTKIDFQGISPFKLREYNYEDVWKQIHELQPIHDHHIPGAFVDWDNTPRKKERGSFFTGVSPEVFYKMFKKQVLHARNDYKQDMIFIFAWNEWAEGGYLEPDEKRKFGFLEAIHRALEETGELE